MDKKQIAIGCGTLVGRFVMAFGCGTFVESVAKRLLQSATPLKKVGIWGGALCTVWALSHAVDSYWDEACEILNEAVMLHDLAKETDEIEE